MNRFVIMVDAGYLLSQAVKILSRRASSKRADLDVHDPGALIEVLIRTSRATLDLTDKELLRIYWYDGVLFNGMTREQKAIVDVNDVQFRAGTVNGMGQQKGVDSLIVTDLIELTTHHAMCDAILVTGDSDLAVPIELAQRRGVRIAVLGLEDLSQGVAHGQSFEITSRADRVARLGGADIAGSMSYAPRPSVPIGSPAPAAAQPVVSRARPPAQALATVAPAQPAPVSAPSGASSAAPPVRPVQSAPAAPTRPLTAADQVIIQGAVQSFVSSAANLAGAIDASTQRIEATVDRALIHHVYSTLARGELTQAEKIFARAEFRRIA